MASLHNIQTNNTDEKVKKSFVGQLNTNYPIHNELFCGLGFFMTNK